MRRSLTPRTSAACGRLRGPQLRAAPGPGFAGGEVEDAGAVALRRGRGAGCRRRSVQRRPGGRQWRGDRRACPNLGRKGPAGVPSGPASASDAADRVPYGPRHCDRTRGGSPGPSARRRTRLDAGGLSRQRRAPAFRQSRRSPSQPATSSTPSGTTTPSDSMKPAMKFTKFRHACRKASPMHAAAAGLAHQRRLLMHSHRQGAGGRRAP